MGILVAEIAIPGDMVPVPVVVEFLTGRHHGRGRARPEIEVEAGRNGSRCVDQPDAWPVAVADGAGHLHVADFPTLHEVECLPHAGHAAALHTHLAHASKLAGPLRDHPALLDVVAAGLFHVDILARLHRPDGHHGMPVVGRGDRDSVDILAVEQTADVLHIGRWVEGVFEIPLA